MKVTFTALRRWSTKEKKRLRKLLHNFEWEYKHFLDVFPVSDHHFLRLFLFKKKFFFIVFEICHYVGSHQWPAAQINFIGLFGEFILSPCSLHIGFCSWCGQTMMYCIFKHGKAGLTLMSICQISNLMTAEVTTVCNSVYVWTYFSLSTLYCRTWWSTSILASRSLLL